ncbi:DNA-binding protein [bacterium]|nr:DNA-binding protein [bacterium]NDD85928.1 DNA-binding protein [bacterium]NDG03327.1 DNA-binding protein [Synechococcaceae bacterium WBB_34_004]
MPAGGAWAPTGCAPDSCGACIHAGGAVRGGVLVTLSEFKAAAAEYGLDWPAVRGLYDSMRAEELAQHGRQLELRAEAFRRISGDEHGGRFKLAHRAEFGGGDHATIPGFDEVAAELAGEYPEALGTETAADDLWSILTTPAPEAPPAADCMARALERARQECPAAPGSVRDLISTAEAAALADVSEQWIRRLVRSGKLPGRQVGRSYAVSAAAAARFRRHPTAGRPRARVHLEPAPF